ncbi:hypothetical protein GGS20DRAFT_538637 [Poronia punctata]|nr:hypothetical protein GGS20DRAFT_538637 [Poronia punctata]
MSFQFVDNTVIDKRARKLIRSHVMKGKNVGKVREPRRKDLVRIDRTTNPPYSYTKTHTADIQHDSILVKLTRQIGNDPTLLSCPVRPNPQSLAQVQQLFLFLLDIAQPKEFCRPTNVLGWMWFDLVFRDEAYFHCTMALTSAFAAFLTQDSYDSPVALYHMSQTFRLLAKKLSSDEALSDSTIAVVTSTSIYDRLYGNSRKAMVHLGGVYRMVELRGGIKALAERNFLVAEKTFRTDFELALYSGSTPKYSAEDVPHHLVVINRNNCLGPPEPEIAISALYQSAGAGLRGVVTDALNLTHLLREQENRIRKLEPAAFQSTIIYFGYRLIEIDLFHQDFTADNSFDKLIHLALIGFMNTFWLGIGWQIVKFPLMMERFRQAAQYSLSPCLNGQKTLLWALFIGRMSLATTADDSWMIPKIRMLADQLRLRSWPEVSGILQEFPWVNVVHQGPGQKLWDIAIGKSQPLKVVTPASEGGIGSSIALCKRTIL